MSRLWPERIRIVLHPTEVVLHRLRRGRRGRVLKERIVTCEPHDGADAPWRGAVSALEAALPEFCTRTGNATVVLSNHFVRYALIEQNPQITTANEERALIHHRFTRIYGTGATQWASCLSHTGRPNHPRVACSVDQALIDALRALFQAGKPTLRSVQPYLMAAFNQYRNRLNDAFWLALVEDGVLCLARLENNQWRSIKTVRIGDDWRGDLAVQLDREVFLSGKEMVQNERPISVLVFAPGFPSPLSVRPELHSEQTLRDYAAGILDPSLWPEPAESAEPPHAMALVG